MLKSPQKELILRCSWLQALVTWGVEVSSTSKTEKEARTTVEQTEEVLNRHVYISQGVLGDPSKGKETLPG